MKRFVKWLKAAMIRYEISSAEDWVRACEREGIFDGRSVREINKQIQAARVRLAIVEAS